MPLHLVMPRNVGAALPSSRLMRNSDTSFVSADL